LEGAGRFALSHKIPEVDSHCPQIARNENPPCLSSNLQNQRVRSAVRNHPSGTLGLPAP